VVLPVVIALIVALAAAAIVVLVQGLGGRRTAAAARHAATVQALAADGGGIVTAPDLARSLGVSTREADRILRSLVDDVRFTMGIDERQGVLQFWYPDQLKTAALEETGTYSWSKAPSAGRTSLVPKIPGATTGSTKLGSSS